ncbi:MAG: sulfotransferase domain-containing protein [Planctomycetota bacterium]|nr:sulfotransferase domain-containing protein [Planctomycetota bacterium]
MVFRKLRKALGKVLPVKGVVPETAVPETVVSENESRIAHWSEEGQRVSFVSSFPRSGNTWTRHILADCLIQNAGLSTTTDLPTHPNRIIPDRYDNRISERDPAVSTPGLIVKTHDRFDVALNLLDQRAHQQMRHLYIYRRPEDCLVSYYHFHLRYKLLQEKAAKGVDAFVLEQIDDWIQHVESYVEGVDRYNGCVFFLSYEQLLADPMACLRPALSFLEVDVSSAALKTAIEHMAFENLRAREEKNPINAKEFFFRKGTTGSGSQELQASTLEAISSKAGEVLCKAAALSTADCDACGDAERVV